MNLESNNKYYENYLDALLQGKWNICLEIINDYLKSNNNNVIDLYENIIKKAMYEIGKLWEHNKISVAKEHLASSITESIISKVFYEIVPMPNANKSILLSCVYNEQHLIGLKMVADVFERHGWHTNILGGNTPTKDLIDMALIMKPDIIALSLTLYFNIDNLYDMINQIRKFIPDTLIIIGGQAFTRLNTENRKEFYNVKYFNNLYSIEEFVINLKGKI